MSAFVCVSCSYSHENMALSLVSLCA